LVKSLHLAKAQGVLVSQVVPEGFAAGLTVQTGDIILSVNHQPVSSVEDFARVQGTLRSGQDVLLLIAGRQGTHSPPCSWLTLYGEIQRGYLP